MDRETLVYVDLDGVPHLMGRLWARVRKNKESASFEYDQGWLQNPARFSLEPALQLGPGPFHTPADTPMFGAIGDSAQWFEAIDIDHCGRSNPAGVQQGNQILSPGEGNRRRFGEQCQCLVQLGRFAIVERRRLHRDAPGVALSRGAGRRNLPA